MVAFVSGMEAIARTIFKLRDPRWYQVFVLSLLLGFGILVLDFGIHWQNAVAIFVAAQVTQLLGARFIARIPYEPLSALITSYSLTLLLRTDLISLAVLAAAIAIGSKFLVRVRGKHVFNPANVALVSLMLLSNNAWVSSGQWGSATIGALALACLGMLVLTKARRAETTLAFIAAYGLLLVGRALWLGDPLSIPLHQLQNGALLIFAFFMISDPKTSPDSPLGRIAYGATVALVAFVIQFVYFIPGAPVYALILCAPIVPLIDHRLAGRRYEWQSARPRVSASPAGIFVRTPVKGVKE
jgi:Na+-transporting NADH:ubiquinone oxidoreductase subunit NqrB